MSLQGSKENDKIGKSRKGGNMRILQGDKVRLRPIEEEDIPRLLEWDSDKEIVRWAGKKFENREDARRWHLTPSLQHRTFAVELLDGRLVGEIEVLNISWRSRSGEMRVCIGEKGLWDRGLGEDAVRTLVTGMFSATAMQELFLRVDAENVRARRCYQKVGFQPEARLTLAWDDDMPRTLLLMRIKKTPRCAGISDVRDG